MVVWNRAASQETKNYVCSRSHPFLYYWESTA
jgi:hypothetical protein